MDNQRFVDGIGAVSVVGSTVRIDFITLEPRERDANGQPKAILDNRLIMSLDAFMVAAAKIQEAVEALEKAGVKLPSKTKDGGPPIDSEAAKTATKSAKKSATVKEVHEKKPTFP